MSKIRNRIQIPALLITLGLAGAVHAATFNVTNGAELQAALTQAQNNGEADTIILADGTYDASGGTFTYVADNTAGSEENFPLTLQGAGTCCTDIDGGGVHQGLNIQVDALTDDGNADITIQGMTFRNGKATTSGGGLFVATNKADIALENCDFLLNNTSSFAGAADLQAGTHGGTGNILVNANGFTNNTSQNETGGVEFSSDAGGIVATNNIFFDNHALNGDSGAVLLQHFSGGPAGQPLQFVNNTVVGNSATTQGGGIDIFCEGSEHVDLYNNIIFNNTAGTNGDDIFIANGGSGTTVNLFNNDFSEICFESSGACDPTAIAGLSQGGQINADPMLGTSKGAFELNPGSPAIDAGDPNAPALPALDIAEHPRISGPAPEMGAFEFSVTGTSGGGNEGSGSGVGDTVSGSGCALQGGTPAGWSSLLASLLLLPLGILRIRRRA